MARRKSQKVAPESDQEPFLGLTPNQVVAHNLTRARELKGWTQEEAAEALEPYLGVRWSKASVSQAERSVAGRFVRNFNADEIVAFARAFDQPVTWFFMPPPAWAGPGTPSRLAVPDAPALGETVALLIDLVFGDEVQQAALSARLDAFLAEIDPGALTASQARITSLGQHRMEALIRQSFQDLGRWQTSLRTLANQLEGLEARAKRAVATEVGIGTDNLRVPLSEADAETGTGAWQSGEDEPRRQTDRKRRPATTTKKARRKEG